MQWYQLQAVLTTNTSSLDLAMIRLKGNMFEEINNKCFNFQMSCVHTYADAYCTVHQHVYLKNEAVECRRWMFQMVLKTFSDLQSEEDPNSTIPIYR